MSDQRELGMDSNAQMSDEALALRAIEAYLGQIVFAQRLARSEQKHIEEVIDRLEKRGRQNFDLSLAYVAAGRLNDAASAVAKLEPSNDKQIAWIRLSVAALAKLSNIVMRQALGDADVRWALGDIKKAIYVRWALERALRRTLEDANVRRELEDKYVRRALEDEYVHRALEDEYVRRALEDVFVRLALKGAVCRVPEIAVRQALEDAVRWALKTAVRRASEDADVRRALEDADARQTLEDAYVRQAPEETLRWVLQDRDIHQMLERAAHQALEDADVRRALEDADARQVLERAVRRVLEDADVRQVLEGALRRALEDAYVPLTELSAVLLRLGAASIATRKLDDARWALEKLLNIQDTCSPNLPLLLSMLGIAARQQQAQEVALWATEQAVREAEGSHSPFLALALLGQCVALTLNQQDNAALGALRRAEQELCFLLPTAQLVEALGSFNRFTALIAQPVEKQKVVQELHQVERMLLRAALEMQLGRLDFFTQVCLYQTLEEAPKQPAQHIHLCRAFLEEMYFASLPRLQVPASALSVVIELLEACALNAEPTWRTCLGLAYLARDMAYNLGWGKTPATSHKALRHALITALPGTAMHAWSVIELSGVEHFKGDNFLLGHAYMRGHAYMVWYVLHYAPQTLFKDDNFLLGHAYLAYGDLDKAIEAFKAANDLAGQGYAHLARYEREANDDDLDKAIQCLEEAEKQANKAPPARGPIMASLGRACLADYKRSAKGAQLDRAIAYLEGSPLHEGEPQVLNDLGEALLCLFERNGRPQVLERAMAYLRRALMLAPPGLPLRAAVLNNLGRAYLARHEWLGDKADLEQADHAFCEALRTEEAYATTLTIEEILGIGESGPRLISTHVVTCRFNQARLRLRRFQRTGQRTDIDGAIQYLQEALALARSGRVKDVPRSSLAHLGIGPRGYDSQTDRIIPMIQNSLGEAYLARHRATSNESDLQEAFSQLEAAKRAICPKEIEQKIAILSWSFSDEQLRFSRQSPALLPAILNNLGKAHLRARQPKEALAHLSVARALVSDTFHPERAEILNYLGLTWWAFNDEKRAIEAWEESQAALRHIISIEPETQALAGLNAQITRQLVSAHYKKGAPRAALSALERGRTVRLQAELARAKYVLNGDQQNAQIASLYRQLAEVAAARRLLFYDYISGRKHLDKQLAALAEQHKQIVAQIIKAQDSRADASLSADQIEALAKHHGVTLIVLYPLDEEDLGPNATLAFVITPEQGLSCHELPLTRQGLRQLIFNKDAASPGWLPAYQASFAGDEQTWQQTIDRVLEELGNSLLAPLHGILVNELNVAEGSSIVLVPCEHLSLLPLHAAPIGNGRCFGDAFVVSYAPSATTLFARADKQTANAQGDPQFVAVVNPDGSLVFAESEVEGIPNTLAKGQAVAYGPDAKLRWLLDKATQADYLHLATHGDFASGWPERSTLLLAHPEGYTEPLRQAGLRGAHLSRAELQDGCEALTLNDLWASRLQLKPGCLVVLSACETGQIEPGDVVDEVLGFPAALLAAGARGVVASLWAVDDLSTSLLMQKMYQEMANGKPPAAALQAASNYLRSLNPAQIRAALESEIQKLQTDYQAGKWQALNLPDQARMFYRITTLQLIYRNTQSKGFSKKYYWSPFSHYCVI